MKRPSLAATSSANEVSQVVRNQLVCTNDDGDEDVDVVLLVY